MSVKYLEKLYGRKAVARAAESLKSLRVETPSWGFMRGGTRFGGFKAPGDAENVEDRIRLAGKFYRETGQGATVALHFPWDGTGAADIRRLAGLLKKAGLKAGAVNSNLFSARPSGALDHRVRFGTLVSPCEDVRKASVAHHQECLDYMRALGSDILALWLPDGTNSPGQMSFYDQAERVEEAVGEIHGKLRDGERLLVEYKFFEPGFYSTAIPDYGRSLALCRAAGDRASVLVDTGHHPLGTNIEQIVSFLIREGRLGGFHFNDHKYADDDLACGSIDPAQLFRIFAVILEGAERRFVELADIAFMIDESHIIKDPYEEMVESATNIEIACAKAALIDWEKLRKRQDACDISAADDLLSAAFHADTRALVEAVRKERKP